MHKNFITSLSLAFLFLCTSIGQGIHAQSNDPLLFPKDSFRMESKTVVTATRKIMVVYRSYQHLLYVSKPVDKDYQRLNVKVPVSIDGKPIDASNAPILFDIGVGGYMSVRNSGDDKKPSGGPGSGVGPGGPGMPMGPPPGGKMGSPGKMPAGTPPQGGKAGNMGESSDRTDLALAAGYVVVSPGCRGRDNQAADGTYYGKAPAAIVDLKAAIRYIRHNQGILPGNNQWIVSVGCSAGGAISASLGASGNSPLFDTYLREIGAAEEKDDIFASGCYSPITDLEHADAAYEWMYGNSPIQSGLVDQQISKQLKDLFQAYQKSLQLQGKDNFGQITADNYASYLLKFYLYPAANLYLRKLSEENRKTYLTQNPWITWKNEAVSFSFQDYVSHVGRMKGIPSFDDLEMKMAEPIEFGDKTTNARHFTNFSLQQATGNPQAEISPELQTLVNMMNALYFVKNDPTGCAKYWWLRNGSSDAHTSQTVMINLATCLENKQKQVNTALFWDGGHCADEDPDGFMEWIGKITGYSVQPDK